MGWEDAPYCPECKSPMELFGDNSDMADVWECDDPDCTFVVIRPKRPSAGWPENLKISISVDV